MDIFHDNVKRASGNPNSDQTLISEPEMIVKPITNIQQYDGRILIARTRLSVEATHHRLYQLHKTQRVYEKLRAHTHTAVIIIFMRI